MTDRTRVRRLPERGVYERDAANAILDEALVCHLGFVVDGEPYVIPTLHARSGDVVYVHGSAASRMLRAIVDESVCLTVTLIDGLVLARSAFHHSANYRSLVVFGRPRLVEEEAEKLQALEAFSEHLVAGRWADVRPPTAKELRATKVLALPLVEFSVKRRTGPPLDDEADYALDVWAGVVPLRLAPAPPAADPRLRPGIEPPSYATDYRR
jgi:nitroimidazol reductase NimA-like FMN-containing flavoprotein (pyridoxamine 5'-phosphate oxidase superfamily)